MNQPPLSIAALTACSKPTGYDPNRSFKNSLGIALKECDAGIAARDAEDVERAFIHFTRAHTLFTDELPTHPRFNHLEPEKQNVIIQRGKEVDIWRSEIKVLVKKRIWEWEVRHLDTPIVARPRVQSESGVNHARTRLKPTSTLDVDSNSAFSEASKYPTTGRHKRTTSDVGVSKVRGSAHEHSSRPRSHSPSNRVRLDPDQLEPAKMAPNNSSSLDVPALRSHLTRLSVQPLVTTIPGPGDKGPNELASNGSHPIPNINTPAVPTLVLTEPTGEQSPESRTNSEASSIETPDGEITFPAIQHHNESNNEPNSQLPGIDKARPRAVSATIPHWRVDYPPTLGNKPRGLLLGPRPGSCPPVPVPSGTKESLENSSEPLFKTAPVGSFDETPTANSLHTSDYFTAPTGFEIALVDELDILSDPEHPESIARLEEGALSYLQAEDFEKATEMFKVVLDLRRRIQGDSHLFTIQTMSNLALGYEGQGEFDQAIGILRETLTELNNSHSSVNVVFRSPIEERLVELHARQAEFAGSMTIVRRTSRGAKRTNSVDQIATRVHSDKSLPFHIDSNTSPETIMAHLTNRRCPDLTHLIDIKQCSAVPVSEGGYGDIWKGMLVGQRPVAMKSLRVNNGRGKLNKRLAQELYAWSKADHENVLKLLGLAYYKDSIVMVSPWMQYGSINAYLEQHPETNRLHIAIQIADGIAHLHRIGIVHGDLKAQNVFASDDGVFKVGDFGLAVLLGERSIAFLPSGAGNNALGTMRWMAPELFTGDTNVSLKSDIYSLGMTIYEVVSGRVPFWELPALAVPPAVCNQRMIPTLPREIEAMGKRGSILWDTLQKCWYHGPQERPTADQVLREMHKVASH